MLTFAIFIVLFATSNTATAQGLCDNGQVNSGRCRDPSMCCSKWGWCGTTAPYCSPDACRGGPCWSAQSNPPPTTTLPSPPPPTPPATEPSPEPQPSPSPSPSPAPSPSPSPSPSPAPSPPPSPSPPPPSTSNPVCGGGSVGVCPDPSMCCSQWGHCGREEAWCGAGCMSGPCWSSTPGAATPPPPPTDATPSPPPAPTPSPVPPSPPPAPPAPPADPSSYGFAGYYMTWGDPWSSSAATSRLASVACYVTHVLLSFIKPDAAFHPDQPSLAAMGLEFSSSPAVVRDAVAALKARCPRTRVLAAVGGATYNNWGALNTDAIVRAVQWLGLDGVDVDYEVTPSCTHHPATDSITCSTDTQLITAIRALRAALPRPYLLTAATFSVGAYGVGAYTAAQPQSVYTGMWVNPLRQAGDALDRVLVMSYDAGPQPAGYDPRVAFAAYRALYPGPIHMGVEIPPEAWGGNVLTLPMLHDYNAHFRAAGAQGMMLWALQKGGSSGGVTAQAVAQAVCVAWELGDCNQPLFGR